MQSDETDFRIFILNSYSGPARKIICYVRLQYNYYYTCWLSQTKKQLILQAQKNNFTYPKYAWISYDWYPLRWWAYEESKIEVSCSDRELAEFLEKVITFRTRPVEDDINAATDAGIVSCSIELTNVPFIINFYMHRLL